MMRTSLIVYDTDIFNCSRHTRARCVMLKVKGISHVQINISDMERSLRFYRDGLGLVERMRTGPYVLLSSTDSGDFISLSQLEPVGAPGLGHFGLHLEADNIATA